MKHNPFRSLLSRLFPPDADPQRAPQRPPPPRAAQPDTSDDDRRHRAVLAEQQRIRESLAYAQSRVQLYLLATGEQPDAESERQHG